MVVFVAKDSDGNVLATNEVECATASGTFEFAIGVPPNTATVSLKPRFYLRKKFSVATDDNHVTLDLSGVSFLGGDANSDNQVQGTDYAWLRALWGTHSNPTYDINGDTVVT